MIKPLGIERMQQAIINHSGLPMGEAIAQEALRYTLEQVMELLEKEYPAITTWQCWQELEKLAEEKDNV